MQPDGTEGEMHPIDWAAQPGVALDVLRELKRSRRRKAIRSGVGAAAGLALAVIALLHLPPSSEPPAPASPASHPEPAYVTLPAHRNLPDGSVVELRDGAIVSVAFNQAARRVILGRGQALFHAAKDAERPFLVQAGPVQVRAIGTAFSVYLGRKRLEILVTEGRVAIDRSQDPAPSAPALGTAPRTVAFVNAGSKLVLDPITGQVAGSGVAAVPPSEMAAKLAWRVPRLEFTGTPLSEVVSAVNRYSSFKLSLGDADLGQVHLSGVMRADNVGTLLELLEEEHGITADQRGPREYVLRKAR